MPNQRPAPRLYSGPLPPPPDQWGFSGNCVRHSWACGDAESTTCEECMTYLCQFMPSQWKRQRELRRRQLANAPAPLDDAFLTRLAYDMAARPHLFAPIITFLTQFQGERT